MVSRSIILCIACSFILLLALNSSEATSYGKPKLSPRFYDKVCSTNLILRTIEKAVRGAIASEKRVGASLLRLHFHDCFVNGCDGSILLDPANGTDSEKVGVIQNSSLREIAFQIIDQIKAKVDAACKRSVVSCADIVAVASRDSVFALGGPRFEVPLGRRDATTASSQAARDSLPTPIMGLAELIKNFKDQGLSQRDLVALSGGHTLGFSQCFAFRTRIYNTTNIDPVFAAERQSTCPFSGGDTNISAFDETAAKFDSKYFTDLVNLKGLLISDQALYTGGSTDGFVKLYKSNYKVFARDFAQSMINMGNIKPLTGSLGQIRSNCRKVNS